MKKLIKNILIKDHNRRNLYDVVLRSVFSTVMFIILYLFLIPYNILYFCVFTIWIILFIPYRLFIMVLLWHYKKSGEYEKYRIATTKLSTMISSFSFITHNDIG